MELGWQNDRRIYGTILHLENDCFEDDREFTIALSYHVIEEVAGQDKIEIPLIETWVRERSIRG